MNSFITMFFDVALKSFVVLGLAAVVNLGLRRANAAMRHWLWFVATASLLCLPLSYLMLPGWQKPLWVVSTSVNSGNQFSMAVELAPNRPAETSRGNRIAPTAASRVEGEPLRANQSLAAHFSSLWVTLVMATWAGGIVMIVLSSILGQIRLRALTQNSIPLMTPEWTRLLDETRERLGLCRPVRILQATHNVMPLTWGCWRPVVLLPVEAEVWSAERWRIVLLHELAHVKRWDCLTQIITLLVCAVYWFNPLAWLAASQMRIERERAVDDLVLNGGCKASEYAGQLVEIARGFHRLPLVPAIAMARPAKLEGRIKDILDGSRQRTALSTFRMVGYSVLALGLAAAVAAQKPESLRPSDEKSNPLRQELLARVKAFAKAKEEQSEALAAKAGGEISPEFRRYFEAAVRGDGETVTNMYESFKHRHPQYEKNSKVKQDESLRTRYWSPVLEICLIYWELMAEEPKYLDFAAKGMVNSIPTGSIYFGGTDPGRGIPTAFSKSHADGDPFFTITQNALADGTYLQYLRDMYGGRIYTPTEKESQDTFQEYLTDVQKRLEEHKLKPGEDVKIVDNRVQVQGQVAVMSINALLTKIIFDKNPDREFYLEESFPLDWMYPHLEPHGLIMKINRQPSSTLSDAVLQQDRKYWSDFVDDALGDWLKMDTSVADVAEFAEKTHVRGDLNGFKGDPRFIRNDDAKKMFSKFRASIAGVYAWRAKETTDFGEKARMTREADFAFRQAWALCPYSPEACFRWVNLLVEQQKRSDAAVVAETTARMPSLKGDNGATVRDLVRNLKDLNVKTAP